MNNTITKTPVKGFTLLEVMVALVMIATAFSAIYLSLSTGSRTLRSLEDKTAATWVALNIIAKKQTGFIAPNQASGTETMLKESWDWQATVSSTPNPGINMITLRISKHENSQPITHVTGYLLNKTS